MARRRPIPSNPALDDKKERPPKRQRGSRPAGDEKKPSRSRKTAAKPARKVMVKRDTLAILPEEGVNVNDVWAARTQPLEPFIDNGFRGVSSEDLLQRVSMLTLAPLLKVGFKRGKGSQRVSRCLSIGNPAKFAIDYDNLCKTEIGYICFHGMMMLFTTCRKQFVFISRVDESGAPSYFCTPFDVNICERLRGQNDCGFCRSASDAIVLAINTYIQTINIERPKSYIQKNEVCPSSYEDFVKKIFCAYGSPADIIARIHSEKERLADKIGLPESLIPCLKTLVPLDDFDRNMCGVDDVLRCHTEPIGPLEHELGAGHPKHSVLPESLVPCPKTLVPLDDFDRNMSWVDDVLRCLAEPIGLLEHELGVGRPKSLDSNMRCVDGTQDHPGPLRPLEVALERPQIEPMLLSPPAEFGPDFTKPFESHPLSEVMSNISFPTAST